MPAQANKTLIGAFIFGGTCLLLLGLVLFGSGRLFRQSQPFLLCFEDSLKGLDVGAPVMFRGVKVGAVTDTTVEINRATMDVRTPVRIEIEHERLTDVTPADARMTVVDQHEMTRHLIDKGLRAQLQMQSLVTGKLFVALDFHPDKPARFVTQDPAVPELPTIRTGLSEAADVLQRIVQRLERLPLEKLLASMTQTFQNTSALLDSREAKESFRNLNSALASAKKLTDSLDRQFPPMAEEFRQAAAESRLALRQLDLTLAALEGMVAEGSPPRQELLRALENFSAAARAVNSLADFLERHPEALLRGKPKAEER
ncbi:MAG: MlaD family protein [Thermodesulfobacteriota bacterium]